MATSAATNTSDDWKKLKQLIFNNDAYLEKLSNQGLFLLVIGNDIHDVLAEKDGEFHLLLALGHKQEEMAKRFLNTSKADDELISSLKASFRNWDKIDETKHLLKIEAGGAILHLHLYSLLRPGLREGYISVPSNVFISERNGIPESGFLSTHDASGPVDNLAFAYSSSHDPSETETGGSMDMFIAELPEGICPDRIRTWTFKEGRMVEGSSSWS